MRTILVILVLLALMVVGGWIVFTSRSGSATVEFRTDKAKSDVENAIGEGEQMINGLRRDNNNSTTTIDDRTLQPD